MTSMILQFFYLRQTYLGKRCTTYQYIEYYDPAVHPECQLFYGYVSSTSFGNRQPNVKKYTIRMCYVIDDPTMTPVSFIIIFI